MTFDIGLGEQHTLNCLQPRGTWKATWDGLGKYTEFFPAIGTIGSNTSKCDLCCQLRHRLVGHFRAVICSLHHVSPQNCHKSFSDLIYTQSVVTHTLSPCKPTILYCFGILQYFILVRERHCTDRLFKWCSHVSVSLRLVQVVVSPLKTFWSRKNSETV